MVKLYDVGQLRTESKGQKIISGYNLFWKFPLSEEKISGITEDIIQSLEKDSLDLKLCWSQSYVNATSMSAINMGGTNNYLNLKAIFVPCDNLSLNLCGVHAFGRVSVCAIFFEHWKVRTECLFVQHIDGQHVSCRAKTDIWTVGLCTLRKSCEGEWKKDKSS